MPPSIWARTVSGLMAIPQSTAQVTRWTTGAPSSMPISTTWATMVLKLSASARPRVQPSGAGVPQRPFSAAGRSTATWRGAFPSSAMR